MSEWVSEWVTLRTDLTDVTLVSEDFTDKTLVINDTYKYTNVCGVREIVVLVMKVNKVADEVTAIEIDK